MGEYYMKFPYTPKLKDVQVLISWIENPTTTEWLKIKEPLRTWDNIHGTQEYLQGPELFYDLRDDEYISVSYTHLTLPTILRV